MMTYFRTGSGYRSRAVRSRGRAIWGSVIWGRAVRRLFGAERELLLAQPPQLRLERVRDLRTVRLEQPGVDEPDDVVALALRQQHPVHAAPGPVVTDIALAHPGPGQVHREHDHSPGRPAQFADLGRQSAGRPESAWQDVCYSHSLHYYRPLGRSLA